MPDPSSIPTLEIGSTLGHFRLESILGEGGMGIVFRAQDLYLPRQVALKVMLPELARREKARQRFMREARLAYVVKHQRIVELLEVNEDRGVPYLAMELLQGESLDKQLTRERIPSLNFTVRVALHVGEGLSIAHQQGMIHRDIKPSNVWVEPTTSKSGFRCKILDFGLARVMEGDLVSTQSGNVLGTPPYMAPEQWDGKEVDQRADLFSLGVMLYQMTTGSLPFMGDSARSIMFAICTQEPQFVRSRNERIPQNLSDLIHQLLAKDKKDRPENASIFISQLQKMFRAATPTVDRAVPSIELIDLESTRSTPKPLDCTKPDGADEKTVQKAQTDWAKYLGRKVIEAIDLGKGINLEMVLIPPGSFRMGAPNSEKDSLDSERPQRLITIEYPFYIGRYAVTQEQYQQIMKVNPSHFQAGQPGAEKVRGKNTNRFPVESVSWYDAKEFCIRISKICQEKGQWRLPSEGEWEYACRAGTTTLFHFGNKMRFNDANWFNDTPAVNLIVNQKKRPKERTTEVSTYVSNAFGLFDMHGNVWEWCEDYFGPYKAAPRNGEPQMVKQIAYHRNNIKFSANRRVLRGGSWNVGQTYLCRSAYRNSNKPDFRENDIGFRVVLLP